MSSALIPIAASVGGSLLKSALSSGKSEGGGVSFTPQPAPGVTWLELPEALKQSYKQDYWSTIGEGVKTARKSLDEAMATRGFGPGTGYQAKGYSDIAGSALGGYSDLLSSLAKMNLPLISPQVGTQQPVTQPWYASSAPSIGTGVSQLATYLLPKLLGSGGTSSTGGAMGFDW